MKSKQSKTGIRVASLLMVTLACLSIGYKLNNGWFQKGAQEAEKNFQVTYSFDYKSPSNDAFQIKAFVPTSNSRQKISNHNNDFQQGQYTRNNLEENTLGVWSGNSFQAQSKIAYTFDVPGSTTVYEIDDSLMYTDILDPFSSHVLPSEYIESNTEPIYDVAEEILNNHSGANNMLQAIYDFVDKIPSTSQKELTTALGALKQNQASCNGKSRLFVAICRNLNIPARVCGGLILNEETKRTSHLWAEVLILNTWVPFDALNGHFARIPGNYLEVYKGDEFFVKRSANIEFDYNYIIAEQHPNLGIFESFNMFHIAKATGLSEQMLSLMILLPFGALLVAIFRNVVGMKTFGVFLPILIAISFTTTGLVFGMISFIAVLVIISLMHYPMLKWGVLHVPKLVVMLSGVVFLMIVLLFTGMRLDISDASNLTFFPIVILTISAEKYARIVVEEGVGQSTRILFQTMLVTLFCYVVVQSQMIFLLIMNFPESLLLIAVAALTLGKWIGLRIAEYRRFGWILS